MRLETEFRIRVQLMHLSQALADQLLSCCDQPTTWCDREVLDEWDTQFLPQPEIAPSTWVKLWPGSGSGSGDDALLLCQITANRWIAWMPDYGELVLDQHDFYLPWDEVS